MMLRTLLGQFIQVRECNKQSTNSQERKVIGNSLKKSPAVIQYCKLAHVLPVIKSVDLSRKKNAIYNICYGNEYRFSFAASEGGGGGGGASFAEVLAWVSLMPPQLIIRTQCG